MSHALTWDTASSTVKLSGTLGRESLLVFWEQRETLLSQVEQIDVSGLDHVDSTGLAMLVRLKGEFEQQKRSLQIVGMSDNLTTLMELYGVKSLLLS
ncbi:lipid asymmetry maintenance protein MlaB [Providencia vermicola]|uniref:Lipid asymmetry maintenance protein MlaB n=2 Tax=Providencia TaxID=586 RepID=A0AAI9MYA2_PROST|nr:MULTISPECIES: lipid asymmetry maintenance protein MlaB [Providencia]ELR5043682.1 lipid asymmetry maintenance protein MlaB [Providencia rettgeri]ELR5037197.1 lipid asymmetry maintenance protein MlaB [Providencia stuartii]ELR5121136.1 lipid asymmetry maintenance protein MlaB [Providencia stuartii]ELR5142236.1 lipid asymmetry maintenance protein MlaB [Providencia stuartii]ELR5291421.1 lipid asymmetry maintenance protein MlaB [Providencia stuartii]